MIKKGARCPMIYADNAATTKLSPVALAAMTPYFTEAGNPAFEEASLVLECRKLYADFLKEEAFADTKIVDAQYGQKDFHKMYVAEIVNAWVKK